MFWYYLCLQQQHSKVSMKWPKIWCCNMQRQCGWYGPLLLESGNCNDKCAVASILVYDKFAHDDVMKVYDKFAHDDVMKWKHFPRYWPFVRGIHRSPVNSQWSFDFFLICAWPTGWVNNREAGDLRRHRARYDVTVMKQTTTWMNVVQDLRNRMSLGRR